MSQTMNYIEDRIAKGNPMLFVLKDGSLSTAMPHVDAIRCCVDVRLLMEDDCRTAFLFPKLEKALTIYAMENSGLANRLGEISKAARALHTVTG